MNRRFIISKIVKRDKVARH